MLNMSVKFISLPLIHPIMYFVVHFHVCLLIKIVHKIQNVSKFISHVKLKTWNRKWLLNNVSLELGGNSEFGTHYVTIFLLFSLILSTLPFYLFLSLFHPNPLNCNHLLSHFLIPFFFNFLSTFSLLLSLHLLSAFGWHVICALLFFTRTFSLAAQQFTHNRKCSLYCCLLLFKSFCILFKCYPLFLSFGAKLFFLLFCLCPSS